VLAGIVLIGYWLAGVSMASWSQHGDAGRWRQVTAAAPPPPAGAISPAVHRMALMRPVDGMDFELVVPKLGYSAVVHEGVGAGVLATAPGHYPQTAWPGEPGNIGVAGHNIFWIRFGDLRSGDEVDLNTRYGKYGYRVSGVQIVSPADTGVLAPAPDRQLTLTTCWPLWAGQFATRRLVIFAMQT
jgi:sortase A